MATPVKITKNGKNVKNEKGEYHWRIAYRKDGAWTSGTCWGKELKDAYAEISARERTRQDKADGMTWSEGHALWEYANEKDAKKPLSQSHLLQVACNVKLFIEMCGDIAICETTKGQLNQFFAERAKVSGSTANRARRLLSIANWLRRTHDVPFNLRPEDFSTYDETPETPRGEIPLADIPRYLRIMWRLPRPPKGDKQYYGAPGKYEHAGALILNYLFLTGVRSSEACNLLESDIEGNAVTFRQKGGRIRRLICNETIMGFIRASIKRKKRFGIEHQYVFFNTRGRPWNSNSLSHFWKRRLRIAAQRGIVLPDRTPHEIRHTFCTIAGKLNFKEKMIQAASGHASVTALRRYVHVMGEMQEEVTNAVSKELAPILKQRVHLHKKPGKKNGKDDQTA